MTHPPLTHPPLDGCLSQAGFQSQRRCTPTLFPSPESTIHIRGIRSEDGRYFGLQFYDLLIEAPMGHSLSFCRSEALAQRWGSSSSLVRETVAAKVRIRGGKKCPASSIPTR
jgi:hypothetical protein